MSWQKIPLLKKFENASFIARFCVRVTNILLRICSLLIQFVRIESTAPIKTRHSFTVHLWVYSLWIQFLCESTAPIKTRHSFTVHLGYIHDCGSNLCESTAPIKTRHSFTVHEILITRTG
jgi:hypothetical protein